jgi:acyl-CoA reductase-like NAD-dependent aldehyde dehydrogenase
MAISAAVTVGAASDPAQDLVVAKAGKVVVGVGTHADPEMGAVVMQQANDRIVGLVDAGEQQGTCRKRASAARRRVPRRAKLKRGTVKRMNPCLVHGCDISVSDPPSDTSAGGIPPAVLHTCRAVAGIQLR